MTQSMLHGISSPHTVLSIYFHLYGAMTQMNQFTFIAKSKYVTVMKMIVVL